MWSGLPPSLYPRNPVQVVTSKGLYDRTTRITKAVQNLLLVATCSPTGGARQELPARFASRLHMLSMTPLTNSTAKQVCPGPRPCRARQSLLHKVQCPS